jgi:putative protein kinase ArgK-like GTPase of G3E family
MAKNTSRSGTAAGEGRGMNKPLDQPETTLEMAQRHVAEGEARRTQQVEVLREMIADNQPEAAREAQQVLATLEDTLATMHEHLRLEEERAVARDGA